MDEGRFALAAVTGTLVEVMDGNPDHNDRSQTTPANDMVVQHRDGSLAFYYHFTKCSTLVYAGQSLLEGQPVGLIGSSGYSTDPHLHFEIQQAGIVYEPGAGACRVDATLWVVTSLAFAKRV